MVTRRDYSEQLNRLLDGDLGAHEAQEIKKEIVSDAAVRREYEGLQRVRSALRSLAQRESPPDSLDVVVDPLILGQPAGVSSRPWVRWLATAAVVVLGVTVVFEVQRRQPESTARNWQELALDGVGAEPTKRFALAPLPTSAAPESQPVGATDRLLAAPAPEIDSDIEQPPAMEVLGPLDGEEMRSRKGGLKVAEPLNSGVEKEREQRSAEGQMSASPEKSVSATARSKMESLTGEEGGAELESTATTIQHNRWPGTAAPAAGGQLFVFMDADTAWKSFEPRAPSEAGRYSLRIKIEDGRVLEVWPVANPPATTRQVRASQLVLGLEIEGVPDGEYSAEVVVEPRDPPTR